jgi:hypothetical protein
MAENNRGTKRKGGNPASIFLILAVVTYFIGLPFPVTAFLGFIAFILFKAQKDGKSLKDLPIPPPVGQQSSQGQGEDDLSTDFGRQPSRDVQDWLKQHLPEGFEEFTAPIEPEPSRTVATEAPARARTAATAQRPAPQRRNMATHPRDLALFLKNGQGLRQAIVAMTVLGPPRALDPYVADPMQSATPVSVKRET